MDAVNLKEARRRLSTLVDAAERGQSTIITRRGKKVARLVPIDNRPLPGLPALDAFRASLKPKGRSLTDELLAQRDEERS